MGILNETTTCPRCGGTGIDKTSSECYVCNGHGAIYRKDGAPVTEEIEDLFFTERERLLNKY